MNEDHDETNGTVDAFQAGKEPPLDIEAQFDSQGGFKPGNKLGTLPRKPSKKQQYMNAFQRAIGADEMEQLARAMFLLATGGDVQAARIVCDYTMGKPVASLEVESSGESTPGTLVINLVSPS